MNRRPRRALRSSTLDVLAGAVGFGYAIALDAPVRSYRYSPSGAPWRSLATAERVLARDRDLLPGGRVVRVAYVPVEE